MRLRRPLLLGIVVLLAGCDNVTWGGVRIDFETSADRMGESAAPEQPSSGLDSEASGAPPPQIGPLVLIGRPGGNQTRLALVGQLSNGRLTPVGDDPPSKLAVADRLSSGNRFALFSEGVRVGSFMARSTRLSDDYCGARPEIVGLPELAPDATAARQFIAVEEDGVEIPRAPFRSPTHNYDQRVASLAMMRQLIPVLGATWPASTLEIRRDVQAFRLPERDAPTIAATFVHRDSLVTGPAPADAYSVFVMGDPSESGYAPSFVTYHRYGEDGKAGPRFFDHLDWNGDGTSEILLEVMGESGTWVSALTRAGDTWRETYHDACGAVLRTAAVTP